MSETGVMELKEAIRELQHRFGCWHIAVTYQQPDGHLLTLQLAGDLLSLELDTGEMVLMREERLR